MFRRHKIEGLENIRQPHVRYMGRKRELVGIGQGIRKLTNLDGIVKILRRTPYRALRKYVTFVELQSINRYINLITVGNKNYIFNDYGFFELLLNNLTLDEYFRDVNIDRVVHTKGEERQVFTGNMLTRDIICRVGLPFVMPKFRSEFEPMVRWEPFDKSWAVDILGEKFISGELRPDQKFDELFQLSVLYIVGHELSHVSSGEYNVTAVDYMNQKQHTKMKEAFLNTAEFIEGSVPYFKDIAESVNLVENEGTLQEAVHDCNSIDWLFDYCVKRVHILNRHSVRAIARKIFRIVTVANVFLIYRRMIERDFMNHSGRESYVIKAIKEATLRNLIVFSKISDSMHIYSSESYLTLLQSASVENFTFHKRIDIFSIDMNTVANNGWDGLISSLGHR